MALHFALILLSLGLLFGSAEMLVKGSASLAARTGLTPLVIGLTVIAFGTSLPELATSIVAAVRRQPDIAIGNVIGSSIFNILAVLGLITLIAPVAASGIQVLDYLMMIGVSLLLLFS
jgi:cation:H+ antiporter